MLALRRFGGRWSRAGTTRAVTASCRRGVRANYALDANDAPLGSNPWAPRRPCLESLEPRLLLSASITEEQSQAIVAGLSALADRVDELIEQEPLTTPLPGANRSLADLLGLEEIVRERLIGPIVDYLAADATPTTDELATVIAQLGSALGDLEVGVDPSSVVGDLFMLVGGGSEIRFEINFEAMRRVVTSLDLGNAGAAARLGFSAEAMIEFEAGAELDVSFGVNVTDPLSPIFFLRTDGLHLRAGAHASDIDVSLNVGVLGAQIIDGQVDLDGAVTIGLNNPDGDAMGDITLAELTGTPIEDLITFDASGTLTGTLPIAASFGSYSLTGNPSVSISSANLFDGSGLDITTNADFAQLLPFRNLTTQSLLGTLGQIGTFLDGLRGSEALAFDIPFARSQTAATALDLGSSFASKVLLPLLDDEGDPTFANIQQFVMALAAALGVDASSIGAEFDPQTNLLTWRLDLSDEFLDYTVPIDLELEAGPLRISSSGATITLSASVEMGMTIGIDLNEPTATIVGSIDAPLNGQLSGEAVFDIQVTGLETEPQDPVGVTVTVPADAMNEHIDDLLEDITVALDAAGLGALVGAGREDDRITLFTRGFGSVMLRIGLENEATNPAATELGFADGQMAADVLGDHLFLEDASLSAQIDLEANNLNAMARLGPLRIEARDGSGSGNVTVSLELKDPETGTPGGRVGLATLYDALAEGDFDAVLAGPTVARSANLSLEHIEVDAGLLGDLVGNPTISLSINDSGDGGEVMVDYNAAMAPILDFENLSLPDILGALGELGGVIEEILGTDLLSLKIPGIDRTIGELADIIGTLEALLDSLGDDADDALQDLEEAINAALPSGGAFMPSVALGYADRVVSIDLMLAAHADRQLPLSIDLSQLGVAGLDRLIDLSVSAPLSVAADGLLAIHLGIDLTEPLSPVFFVRDTTRLELQAQVNAPDIDFNASLGPLGVFIRNGTLRIDDGALGSPGPAAWTVTLTEDETDHRYRIDELSLSLIESELVGEVEVILPTFFPLVSNFIGNVELTVAELGDIEGTTTLIGPDFGSAIEGLDLVTDLGALANGWDGVFVLLEQLLDSGVLGERLPLIGRKLADAADLIDSMRQQVRNELDAAGSFALSVVHSALFEALGPDGLGWLIDTNDDMTIDVNDISVQSDADHVEFGLRLSKALAAVSLPIDFDLGLPGLGLELDGEVQLMIGVEIDIGVGVSESEGFYINTSGSDDVVLTVHATLPGFEAVGSLFFIRVEAEDDAAMPSAFEAMLAIDLLDPVGANHRLTLNDLASANIEDIIDASLSGGAAVNLDLLATFNGQASLPSLAADFAVEWMFDTGGFAGSAPLVRFDNVRLNLGEFFSDLIEPVVDQVQDLLAPLQPLIDVLNEPLPVLSDLARRDVTLVDVAGALGFEEVSGFIDAVSGIAAVADFLATHVDVGGGIFIDLGGFNLSGHDLRQETTEPLNPTITAPSELPFEQLSGDALEGYELVRNVGEGGFVFPLFENPALAFNLLLGEDVDLVLFDMPALSIGGHFSAVFPVFGPLYAFMRGAFSAGIDLAFGYDTSGLRKFAQTGRFADVFDGFFISDTTNPDGTGKDQLEAFLTGAITAGLEINIVVAKAGIEGGVFATIGLDLDDPDHDGKVYKDEFLENLEHGLLCTFHLTGELSARLRAYYQVLFGSKREYELAAATLLDFNIADHDCVPDRLESNETMATAAPIGVGPGVHLTGASLRNSTDVDWYSFEVPRNVDAIDVAVDFTHKRGDIELDVYDAAGNRLKHGRPVGTDRKLAKLTNLTAGTYFVHLYGHGERNVYDLSIEPGASSDMRVFYVNDPSVTNPAASSYYTLAPGNDANDGLSPLTPKASLASVLADYALGSMDIVVIDTGTYGNAAVITSADEGAAYAGTPAGSQLALNGTRLTIDGADDNLLHELSFTGIGGVGIELVGDAMNNTLRANRFDMAGEGIRVDSDAANLVIDNVFRTRGSIGIHLLSGASATVRGNSVAGQSTGIMAQAGVTSLIELNDVFANAVGIDSDSLVATVIANEVHHNDTGLTGNGVLGPASLPAGSPPGSPANRVFNNVTGARIDVADSDAVVRFNNFFNNATAVRNDSPTAQILGNDVHDNMVGLAGGGLLGAPDWNDSDLINLVRNNEVGIQPGDGAEVRFNRVFGNDSGIRVIGAAMVHHNVVYGNGLHGVLVDGADGATLRNNTIHAAAGDGVRLKGFSTNTTLRDNIIYAGDDYALRVETDSQRGLDSDYNNLFAIGSAAPVWYEKPFADLFDWQAEAGQDLNSLGTTSLHPTRDDPMFVDAGAGDYRLTDEASTSIDAGDPATPIGAEPSPHGGRVNLGAYGGTALAALSPNTYIAIDWPEYYTDWEVTESDTIRWHAFNAAGSVDIDLYEEGVGKVADIAVVPVGDGSFTWSPMSSGVGGDTFKRYRVKLTLVDDPAITDESREPFAVPIDGDEYYVDDRSDVIDHYTPTAPGDNRNTGRTSIDPKADLRPILDGYNTTGATLRIDTGQYIQVSNYNLGTTSGITDDSVLLVIGPMNGGTAHIDRANPYDDSVNFDVSAANDGTISNLTLVGAQTGIVIRDGSTNFTVVNVVVANHSLDGLFVAADAVDPQVSYVVAADNGRRGISVATRIDSLSFNVAHRNEETGLNLVNAGPATVEANDVRGNGVGIYAANPAMLGETRIGNDNVALMLGNTVSGNDTVGIIAVENVRVTGNGVSANGTSGIELQLGADALYNTVSANLDGIVVNGSADGPSLIDGNTVARNENVGIRAASSARVVNNIVHTHEIGIQTVAGALEGPFAADILNNLVYQDRHAAIQITEAALGARLVNNTVYETCDTNVSIPQPEGTTLSVGWDWFTQLRRFPVGPPPPPPPVLMNTWGTAQFALGAPVGQFGGGTFNLGAGGVPTDLTAEPVPPGEMWQVPLTLEQLHLSSAMFPPDPLLGPMTVSLSSTLPSVGHITVQNVGGLLVGEMALDLFVEFQFPQTGLVVKNQAPMRVGRSVSASDGLNEFQLFAVPPVIALLPAQPMPGLVNAVTLQPWGVWEAVQGQLSPGSMTPPLPPAQSRGETCARLGIEVLNSADVFLRNNIAYVEGSEDPLLPPEDNSHVISVAPDATIGWQSDYNLLTTRFGNIGRWADVTRITLADWQTASNDDFGSFDPGGPDLIWVDPDGADGILGTADDNFHLQRNLDRITSPIDRGDGPEAPPTDLESLPRVDEPTLTNIGVPVPDFVDLGAYEYQGSGLDTMPPTIVASTPAFIHAAGVGAEPISVITLAVSEPLDAIAARSAANYELREAGANGLFDDTDDTLFELTPAYVPGLITVDLTLVAAPAMGGRYRLTVNGTGPGILDRAGLSLDGDGDMAAGGNYVRIFENQLPGFLFGSTDELVTTEAGGAISFNLRLTAPPAFPVSFGFSFADPLEIFPDTPGGPLVFDMFNWAVPQAIVITGLDDNIDDGDINNFFTVGPTSSADPLFDALPGQSVTIVNLDDDEAGITVTPLTSPQTTEAGGQAVFSIVLNTRPISPVTIDLASSDPSEASVSTPSITFAAETWSTPQVVTLTGLDDPQADGDRDYRLVIAPAISGDLPYANLNAPDPRLTNLDDDAPAILVAPTIGLVSRETADAPAATFEVVLASRPFAPVIVPIRTTDATEALPEVIRLTFTPADWDQPRVVRIIGQPDGQPDGAIAYSIETAPAISDDPAYAGLDADDVALTNLDDLSPTGDAGPDQTVDERDTVQMSLGFSDPEGRPLTYQWSQISGPPIMLSDSAAPDPTFDTPAIDVDTQLTFEVRVSDGTNAVADTVTITIIANTDPPPIIEQVVINEALPQRSRTTVLQATFSSDVGASIDAGDLTLHNDTLVSPVSIAGAAFSYDAMTRTVRWDVAALALPDGQYTATLVAAGVFDIDHRLLDGDGDGFGGDDYSFNFFQLAGDFDGDHQRTADDIDALAAAVRAAATDAWLDLNRDDLINAADRAYLIRNLLGTEFGDVNLDGKVNITDLSKVAIFFGAMNTGWATGDVTGDGRTDISDLSQLAVRFGFMAMGGGSGSPADSADLLADASASSRSRDAGVARLAPRVLRVATPQPDQAPLLHLTADRWSHIRSIIATWVGESATEAQGT